MANKFALGESVVISDGDTPRQIFSPEDDTTTTEDIPDGSTGIVTNTLPGGEIYVVAVPFKVGEKMLHGHALFAESELSKPT